MKTLVKEYLHIIAIGILGILFGIAFYYIFINAFHSASINKKVYVSNNDIYYKNYQNNLNNIKSNLDNYKYVKNKYKYDKNKMDLIYSSINTCYNKLNSKDGFYKNQVDTIIGYVEVNELNDYFINSLINECYIVNLANIANNSNKTIADILSNNALYIKNELRDNSSYYYNTKVFNSNVRNNLNSSYRFILKNYSDFSFIILELSNYLVSGD